MATKKLNTMSSMGQVSDEQVSKWEQEIDALCKKWNCKKVPVTVPKQLQSLQGHSIPIGLNFEYINVPVDGKTREIPEPMAEILNNSLRIIQAQDVEEDSRYKDEG